jgi:putative hydrolase of the HAD superfamily
MSHDDSLALKEASSKSRRVWLFDLDDTLHDAGRVVMPVLGAAMEAYVEEHLALSGAESAALRRQYWLRYGATLLGLVRHHGVKPAHFLHQTHLLPGVEAHIQAHAADLLALARLPGRKYILTNAPLAYAQRVLGVLGIAHLFDGLLSIEDMHMFGHLRPKPDARMLRHVVARLKVPPSRCTLVEDTLAHQKAARRVGMKTVWMQRWLPLQTGRRRPLKPAYVDRRIHHIRALLG